MPPRATPSDCFLFTAATQFPIPTRVGLPRDPHQGICPGDIVSSAGCSHLEPKKVPVEPRHLVGADTGSQGTTGDLVHPTTPIGESESTSRLPCTN